MAYAKDCQLDEHTKECHGIYFCKREKYRCRFQYYEQRMEFPVIKDGACVMQSMPLCTLADLMEDAIRENRQRDELRKSAALEDSLRYMTGKPVKRT